MEYYEQILKAKVYENLIKQSFIDKNQFPTPSMVQDILDRIDLRYSILRHQTVIENTEFDVNAFNTEMYCMYMDLLILYQSIMIYEAQKYSEFETEITGYISSLEEIADNCEKLTKYHTESTGLGTTILYRDKSFNTSIEDNRATITLYLLKAEPRSELTCFIDGTGFKDYNVVFNFYQEDKIVHCSSPYSVTTAGYIIENGNLTVTYREFSIDESLAVANKTFQITGIDNISSDKIYKIFGGKNKIYIADAKNTLQEKVENLYFTVPANSLVRFYLKDPTYLNFEFSEEPVLKNFSDYQNSSMPKGISGIEFTAGDDDIIFYFDTDGELYAERMDENIVDGKLYATKKTTATDLLVAEIEPGDPVEFGKITVTIDDIDRETFHINSIAIKQYSNLKE